MVHHRLSARLPGTAFSHVVAIMLLLILAIQPAMAESTHWVRDILYVTLREGPGGQHPVITTLQSGDGVEVLEDGGDGNYIRVRTENGREGWIQEQYLSEQRIAADRLEAANNDARQARSQRDEARSERDALRSERDQLGEQVETLSSERDELRSELETLRETAERPMELAQENETLQEEHAAMEEEVSQLRREMQAIEGAERRDWFLIGAGVLLAGLILGLILPHLRGGRRSSWEL